MTTSNVENTELANLGNSVKALSFSTDPDDFQIDFIHLPEMMIINVEPVEIEEHKLGLDYFKMKALFTFQFNRLEETIKMKTFLMTLDKSTS